MDMYCSEKLNFRNLLTGQISRNGTVPKTKSGDNLPKYNFAEKLNSYNCSEMSQPWKSSTAAILRNTTPPKHRNTHLSRKAIIPKTQCQDNPPKYQKHEVCFLQLYNDGKTFMLPTFRETVPALNFRDYDSSGQT